MLNGGVGADVMIGGAGNDTYYVDNVGDQVIEEPKGAVDTVITTLTSYTLGASVENLTYSSQTPSRFGFTGSGNELANVIIWRKCSRHAEGQRRK